mgnify:CR=1 FL=1
MFDLIGFGANGSQVTINDVRLLNANTAPVAVDDAMSTLEDQPIIISMLVNDTDTEGDTLTPIIVQAPVNGTLVPNADGSFTYTPNANYFGADNSTCRHAVEQRYRFFSYGDAMFVMPAG